MLTRRLFLGGLLTAGACAPAIVRSGVLMPVRPAIIVPDGRYLVRDGIALNWRDAPMPIMNKFNPGGTLRLFGSDGSLLATWSH
jgi:hypothetical protein